tara:strand:+ start:170 stop:418 length:249 start_codon:yes stop_codon:yes gene_type:complete
MKIIEKFGNFKDLKVGDLVFWTKLTRPKFTGVVSEINSVFMGGRNIQQASIFCFEDQKIHIIPTIVLKKLKRKDNNNDLLDN